MARAPFQVLVIPYLINTEQEPEFAVLQRQPKSGAFWQWISGGGEGTESLVEAAKRETFEEAGIEQTNSFTKLDAMCMIQKDIFIGNEKWTQIPFVIPEYSFAVRVETKKIAISEEHSWFKWVKYSEAMGLLKWDSNKTALWELNQRILTRSIFNS